MKHIFLSILMLLHSLTFSFPLWAEQIPASKIILVTGATGTQGGAVARELLKRGYVVRGLTRNPAGDQAQALRELGIIMVKGDFDDAKALGAAMTDAYGVFAVTDFWEHGYEGEVSHGRKLIKAAETAGISHFVYTSVAGAQDNTGIPHFDSKGDVEDMLADSNLQWSVVRPVEFMDNWRWSKDEFMAGRFIDPRAEDSMHQWIAAADIGHFVGEAFDHPRQWKGRSLDIAGDEMSIGELVKLLSAILPVEVHHKMISWEELEETSGEEITLMIRWFDEVGYSANVKALRGANPDLITVEEFLRALNWESM